jgi:signal peptidase I
VKQMSRPFAALANCRHLITKSFLLALTSSLWLHSGCSLISNQRVVFESTSMLPGIKHGDRLLISRFDRGAKFALQRGDIILFRFPGDPSRFYIKRLIGLPGDTVEIREASVFLNETALPEPYLASRLNASRGSRPRVRLPEH